MCLIVSDKALMMAGAQESDAPNPAPVNTKDDQKVECAVCLQTSIYPVQLPCSHIFCYLCVKGFTTQSKRCAMCRREVPADYLLNPELLEKLDLNTVTEKGFDDDDGEVWQWMYEGRNGWWLYDERTSVEVEKCFKRGDQNCELLIAGFLYIIDFEHMLQYRRNDPSRRRRIKRDLASAPKKGVAGLRMESDQTNRENIPAASDNNESHDVRSNLTDPDHIDLAEAIDSLNIHSDYNNEEDE